MILFGDRCCYCHFYLLTFVYCSLLAVELNSTQTNTALGWMEKFALQVLCLTCVALGRASISVERAWPFTH